MSTPTIFIMIGFHIAKEIAEALARIPGLGLRA
jgi:hypothetical protein